MAKSIWGSHGDLWPTIPPPFAPSGEDLELYRQACPPELLADDAVPRILVLGVTPQLVNAPWPRGSELHAVDYDEAMIASLWRPREGAHVHLARWQELPLPDDYFDLVVGDCAFNALPDQSEYDAVLRQIARVSRPSAPMISRFFIRPEPRPTFAELVEKVQSELADLPAPAKRLLVYIAAADAEGRLYNPAGAERIREQWGDPGTFFAAMGQTPEQIERTKLVFTFEQRVNYPTTREIVLRFAPFFGDIRFESARGVTEPYCPIVRFARASS